MIFLDDPGSDMPVPKGLPMPSRRVSFTDDELQKLGYLMYFCGTFSKALQEKNYCDLIGAEDIKQTILKFRYALSAEGYGRREGTFAGTHDIYKG